MSAGAPAQVAETAMISQRDVASLIGFLTANADVALADGQTTKAELFRGYIRTARALRDTAAAAGVLDHRR